MKTIFKNVFELAKPYLNTRKNDVHTEISIKYAFKLLENEDGNEAVVIPAIILHDVGWTRIPEELQLKAFGPKATSPQLNRVHEEEGVKIAREVLQRVEYDNDRIKEILGIIDGHDSRRIAVSLNDKIVKDADKLWRYSKEGFQVDVKRFKETAKEGIKRIASNVDRWFFTNSAKELARNEVKNRLKESDINERNARPL
jgi:HD superfamily phosphodiesterase